MDAFRFQFFCILRAFQRLSGGSIQPWGAPPGRNPLFSSHSGGTGITPSPSLFSHYSRHWENSLHFRDVGKHADVRYTLAEIVKLLRGDHKEEARGNMFVICFQIKGDGERGREEKSKYVEEER